MAVAIASDMSNIATTYSESAKGIKIDVARAELECVRHGIVDAESLAMMRAELFGRRSTIAASKLLRWLGY